MIAGWRNVHTQTAEEGTFGHHIADFGHIAQNNRLTREQGGCQERQGGVFVAGWADRAT